MNTVSIMLRKGQVSQDLPTPYGRSVAPWRELEPMPEGDSRLPAKDKLITL